jgi:hypothetical protein
VLVEIFGQLGFAFDGKTLFIRVIASQKQLIGKSVSYEQFLSRRALWQRLKGTHVRRKEARRKDSIESRSQVG